jgi:glycosyltransferase involved in cell wall biosynthesis
MPSQPLVSVIIPTYNRAGVISQTIDNVLSQTYKHIELTVIDDGSTDETQSVLRKYGNRIRVITQANAGPAAARNRGIEASRGEIIAFQDSDDLWMPTKLEQQVAILNMLDNSVPCCLCNAIFRVIRGREYTSFDISCFSPSQEEGLWLNVAEVLATRFILFNQTVAIRRKALEKVGGFDESLKYLEDYDLPLRLALEGPWAFIRKPLVIYREGSEGSFAEKAAKDSITLKECEIRIFEQALLAVKDEDGGSTKRQLRWRLNVFRRQLLAAKLSQSRSLGALATATLFRTFDTFREKVFRRSPWYPKAHTVPLAARVSYPVAEKAMTLAH